MSKLSSIFTTDLLIVGAGVGGLSAAIEAVKSQKVFLVCKDDGLQNTTALAQGGIAVAISPGDTPALHAKDTLFAGAGLCDKKSVKLLVNTAVNSIQSLIQEGIAFDRDERGLKFTREAAHSTKRILYAGDSTGLEILRTQRKYLLDNQQGNLEQHNNSAAIGLLVQDNSCFGGLFYDFKHKKQFAVLAKNTLLATGGYVGIYSNNTNPRNITGDGLALAYKAGAVVQDVEFVQFHPTTLYFGNTEDAPLFLISEAVRGEGAVLRNVMRERFMPDYHPLAELAPRDIVSRAIINEMHKTNASHVLLDFSKVKMNIQERFPQIYRQCKLRKINITKDLVPVVPAAHYAIGGVKTDLNGQTSVKHLYACGEVSSTGVHGANRLASNSLLEGLVFGEIAARHAKKNLPKIAVCPANLKQLLINTKANFEARKFIRDTMWQNVGIIRDKESLQIALRKLKNIDLKELDFETKNMLTCALLVTEAALKRQESRGCHYRADYPRRQIMAKHSTFIQES